MERLKQAVEKARRQREDIGQIPENTVPIKNRVVQDRWNQNFSYTQTKIVEVSKSLLKQNRIITGFEDQEILSAYKLLRTQVLQRLRENNWNSLAITSPGMGEGKTLTAINLAISLAREVNHTVLLVDLDLRRPSVASFFGFKPEFGISDYIANNIPFNEILVNPGIDSLVILPGREAVTNSSETLSSPKMISLVEEMKNRYPKRIVLFDMPPALLADDVLAFSPFTESSLIVVEEGKTREEELLRTIELLQSTNILGTVLNKTSEKTDKYY